MSWISPTGHNDPFNKWNFESYAYDDNLLSRAAEDFHLGWGPYLELTHAAIFCDRVRYYVRSDFNIDETSVDVYYDSGWVNIYEGAFTEGTWETKVIPAGIKHVTGARFKFKNNSLFVPQSGYLYEVAFWETHKSLVDTNIVIRTYLLTSSAITDPLINLIGGIANPRLYQGRLPENVTLPAISYFTRGGYANRFRRSAVSPSVQFDCWDDDPIDARILYRALYDALHSIGNADITIGGTTYYIIEAREEVQGQDLVDVDIPGFFRVLTFYQVTIRDDL